MTKKEIFNYLVSLGFTKAGAAGLMGNLKAESNLDPKNLQNTCERRLGLSDSEYTKAVDNGSYDNFVRDSAGYGLAQWTYWSRKQNLLEFAKSKGASIGDCKMQLDFLFKELKGYKSVFEALKTTNSVKEASDIVLTKFEKPADQSEAVKKKRAQYGQDIYNECAKNTTGNEGKDMAKKYASKVVSQAKAWIGRKESDGTHMYIVNIYNNHKPLARSYKVKSTDSWCATFGSAVAIVLDYTDIIPTECSCGRQIELWQDMGCWVEDDKHVPGPGEYIYYDWDDTGKGDCTGWPEHVGIVEKVVNGIITVIEGNYKNAVGRREIKVGAKNIRGYGVPKYDAEPKKDEAKKDEPKKPASTSKKKTVDELAKEVIAGKHGTGHKAREASLKKAGYNNYAEVRKRVNEIMDGKNTSKATSSAYYKKYTGKSTRIDEVLKAIGVPEKYRGKWSKRKPLAIANDINGYIGGPSQNLSLIAKARAGKLRKPL